MPKEEREKFFPGPIEAVQFREGIYAVSWGIAGSGMPCRIRFTASVVVTLPLVLLVFACQKRIVEGLTAGALKE